MNPLARLIRIAALAVLTLAASLPIHAQNGTWTNTLSGTWSDPLNWLNGVVARGAGNTANFSTIDVPAGTTITVTADIDPVTTFPFVIGNMLFGDTVTSDGVGNWVIADGGAGMVLDSKTSTNCTIQVNLAQGGDTNLITGWGTVTIAANLDSTNTLVKTGPAHLILNPATASVYTGGTVISNGMVFLGINNNNTAAAPVSNQRALGYGPVFFRGGTLRLNNAAIPGDNGGSNPTGNGLTNDVVVEVGQKGTIYLTPRAFPAFNSAVSGGGTLTVFADFVRDDLAGNWSAFTGRVNIASSPRQATGDLRFTSVFANAGGMPNGAMSIVTNGIGSSTVVMYNNGAAGNNIVLGELSAVTPGIVEILANSPGAGAGSSLAFVLRVGGLNTDASFSGNFAAPVAPILPNGVGIIKEGTGTWILNGQTIENNGMCVVSNGVLQFGSGTTGKPGRAAVLTNYATLAFGRSDTLVVTNVIDGPGTLMQRGGGTLILLPGGGSNTFTGKTVVTNGLLVATPEAALGPNPASLIADQLTLNGGGLRSTNNQTISDSNRGITLGSSGGILSPDTNTTLTIATPIAGSGSLTVNGAGTATLTGANTYSGKTILKTGTLALSSEAILGAAPGVARTDQLTFDGGTLRSTATFAIDDSNRGLTVGAGGGTVAPDASTTLTISEPMAGAGTLTKAGAGVLVLNASGTYSGNFAINQGTLAVGASGAISGTSSMTIASGATLDVSAAGLNLVSGQTVGGNGTVVGTLTAGNGSRLSAGTSAGALTVSGNLVLNGATNIVEISNSTNDIINVSGNLTLTGVSTMSLVPLSTLPAGTYTLIKYGGTLTGGAANLALTGYPLTRLTANLVVNAGNKSIDLVLSGASGSLVWTGGLLGNAWDVSTTANWLNGASKDTFFNGDSVSFTAIGSSNPIVNLVASVIAGATANSTTDYTISGSGKLTGLTSLAKSGTGKLTILTTNDYTAGTTISGGTLQVGNGTAAGSLGSGSIADNSSLVFNLPGSQTVASDISGTGSLTAQTGSLILSGSNSYGATVINNGATLQVGAGGTSGSLGSGGVTDNGSLIFKRTGIVTNTGSISGSGSLAVQSGTAVLAANNNYSGPTTVDAGTLRIGAGGTAGTLGSAGSVTLTNGGTLSFNRSDNLTNIVAILGTNGTLNQAGPGTLIITNDSNDYGLTTVTGGRLQIGDGVNPSGTIGKGNVTVTGTGTLVLNRPDVYTFSNNVSGSGSVLQIGTNLNLTTAPGVLNTYSGGTTISNSTVVLVAPVTAIAETGFQNINAAGLGTGTITFLGNSTLELAAANANDPYGNGTGNFSDPINIPAGQTGTMFVPGRFTFSSTISGAGTLNLRVNYVRGDVTANWTAFTGQLNILPRVGSDEFRISSFGMPNTRVYVTNGARVYHIGGNNRTIDLGELTGDGTLGPGNGNSTGPTWRVGAANTDATFDGVIANAGVTSVLKVGTGKWTLTGVSTYTGTTTVSNGVLALSTNALGIDSTNSSLNIVVAAPGVFDVTGLTDGTLHLGEIGIQTNGGNGTVRGKLLVGISGTVSPGFSNTIAALTVTSNVTVNGTLLMEINSTNSPTSDMLVAPSIFVDQTPGFADLEVINLGTDPPAWAAFKLTSVPITGRFVTVNLPPFTNPDLVWSNRMDIDGTIVAASLTLPPPTVNTGRTNIVAVRSGNTLDMSWPADHISWRLQVQTNSTTVGLSTNWVDVPGSASTNRVIVPIDSTQGTIFYRMIYP